MRIIGSHIISNPTVYSTNFLCKTITHWGRLTHICIGKLTIIGSDNGLSPARRQAIIWTNAGILLIGRLGTNFSEILIGIQIFSFTKIHSKISSAKWRPFCLGPNVLKRHEKSMLLELSDGNPLGSGGFPTQRARNAMSWHHHDHWVMCNIM